MKSVKIVTINTWKCDGDYALRMQILARQLAELKPDIVLCQECFLCEETGTDTLKFLAGALQMDYTFLPGRFKKRYFEGRLVDSSSGLGILSNYTIDGLNELNLPVLPEDDDRKAQQAKIVLPDGEKIIVTNAHLTHLGNAVGVRSAQAEALAEFAAANKNGKYHIIGGDFNCMPGSIEINTFINKSGAIDCYAAGNGEEPRYSLTDALVSNKKICVDHIFALPLPGENKYPRFINSGIVLNIQDKETGLYPSDHFGLYTEMVVD